MRPDLGVRRIGTGQKCEAFPMAWRGSGVRVPSAPLRRHAKPRTRTLASSSRSSDRCSSPTSGCSMSRRTRTSPRSRREFAAEPIGLLLVLVAALTFTGEIGFRRRDIVSSAWRDGIQPTRRTGSPNVSRQAGGSPRVGTSTSGAGSTRGRAARAERCQQSGGSIGARHAECVWRRRRVGVVARAECVPRHGRCQWGQVAATGHDRGRLGGRGEFDLLRHRRS